LANAKGAAQGRPRRGREQHRMTSPHTRHGAIRRAFTLIELLVVIAIIALLISIILPSLGSARKTAWTVMCQSNLRQLGIAIQGYLDDQKDPVFMDLHNSPGGPSFFNHVGVVETLQPYLSDAGSKPFECPAAKGLSSVRDPQNIGPLQQSLRIFTLPFPNLGGTQPLTAWTEYWFNDSIIVPESQQYFESGVSARRMRLIRNPQWVVWSMDALDQFPRHEAKVNTGQLNTGKDNLLFGDHSVRLMSYSDYEDQTDPAGAVAPFFSWGHFYHR
jgi:prepilin-type N-terminal cleavage/methylation domain-containing protein